jgi:membrane-bound lytic murein transglycosylase B
MRMVARGSAAVLVVAVPVAMVGLSPSITSAGPSDVPVLRTVAYSTQPVVPEITAMQRHHVGSLPTSLLPQAVAEQTTISAGLSLKTKADRNRKVAVSSAKGSRVWTASALAEHDVPAAALRAYKVAARTANAVDPGCRLSWTLLAGIGRVESDHGRYGGSVLGNDGVPRPAIVGVPLNGKGPVAAIRDTDRGSFDGDKVWDRAVGPMQFIPSTWQGAGRDGDRDGTSTPNDIDDAALAAAGYLCSGAGSLDDEGAVRAAVFRYNPSDYYVALVTAFARGYRTGVFVIPSPEVDASADDGDRAAKRAAKAARAAKARAHAKARAKAEAARARAARLARAKVKASTSPAPVRTPAKPKPTPTTPPKPSYASVSGQLVAAGSGWRVGTKTFSWAPSADYDRDGKAEGLAGELAGVIERSGTVTLTYQVGTSPLKVTRLAVTSLAPPPSPAPSEQPSATQSTAAQATATPPES